MRLYSRSEGSGLLNRTIDALPFEIHLFKHRFCGPGTKLRERLARGDRGINPLDELCRSHDIAYSLHKDSESRRVADIALANKAWERFKNKDTPIGEKLAAWIVTTAMNAKTKMGAGTLEKYTQTIKKRRRTHKKKKKNQSKIVGKGGASTQKKKKKSRSKQMRKRMTKSPLLSFGAIVRSARAAVKGSGVKSSKAVEKDAIQFRRAIKAALKAARKFKKGRSLRPLGKRNGKSSSTGIDERVLPLPKSGGFLPLLPIFAGLSAIGSLAGGAAGVAKAISETRDASRRLDELKRHNETMEAVALRKGRGLFLKPHSKTGGLGLYMMPYSQHAKNC